MNYEKKPATWKPIFPLDASLLDNSGGGIQLENQLIPENSFLGSKCRIYKCIAEDNVYISNFAVIDGSTLGNNVLIGAYSRICNTKIGAGPVICNYAKIRDTEIGCASLIGSYCELGRGIILKEPIDIRPGAKISSDCKVKVITKGGAAELVDINKYLKEKKTDLSKYLFV